MTDGAQFLTTRNEHQVLPADVDYRVMLTFLEFYRTLLAFVNFKASCTYRSSPSLPQRLECLPI